jgi:hypothetical protein
LVTAKIPDPETKPQLHAFVTTCMLHGPCNASSNCWQDDECKEDFPKPFSETTAIVDDAYPQYRRRNNGRTFTKQGVPMHNGYVVPYNKYLLLRYNCHINVEIPYGIQALKYLFKYICKGVDRSSMRLSHGDETEKYINGRYVGPSEGVLKSSFCLITMNLTWFSSNCSRLATFPVPNKWSIPSNSTSCRPSARGAHCILH